jgi:hypothetical protein
MKVERASLLPVDMDVESVLASQSGAVVRGGLGGETSSLSYWRAMGY